MSRRTSNIADVYIGTPTPAKVQHIASAVYDIPERPLVVSDALSDDEMEVLGVGVPGGPRTMTITVELDSADTNGQGVLDAAFSSGDVVPNFAFYPDGRVVGAESYTGSVYVQSAPQRGSTGNENKAKKGTFKLGWAATPTKGTYSV